MDTNLENSLKEAYFLELRGKALYQDSIRDDMSAELKELFAFFAREEDVHAAFLKEQLQILRAGKVLFPGENDSSGKDFGFSIKKIALAVSAAGYEGALVGAALDFERRAFEFYSQEAKKSDDPGLKALYGWLADWESGHMALFAELDREIREKVWYDNSFWPLD